MGNLIFIIIIVCIIVSRVKKQSQGRTSVPNQPRPQQPVRNYNQRSAQYNQRPQNYGQYQQRQNYGQRPVQNQSYRQSAQNYSQRAAQTQQELKNRLQQKYGNRNSAYGTPQPRPMQNQASGADDILNRAKNNVRENAQDEMLDAMSPGMQNPMATPGFQPTQVNCAKPEDACGQNNQWHAHDIMEHDELMEQVNDLIVKGYSGNLTFERDFVAEGVEMLNRFELS